MKRIELKFNFGTANSDVSVPSLLLNPDDLAPDDLLVEVPRFSSPIQNRKSKIENGNVTDLTFLSRHVTDDVTDVLEKNLGKTVFVTLSRMKRGALPPSPSPPPEERAGERRPSSSAETNNGVTSTRTGKSSDVVLKCYSRSS